MPELPRRQLRFTISDADMSRASDFPVLTASTSDLISEFTLGRFELADLSASPHHLTIANAPCFYFVGALRSAFREAKAGGEARAIALDQAYDLRLKRSGADHIAIRDDRQPTIKEVCVEIRSFDKELFTIGNDIIELATTATPELKRRSDLDEIRRAMRSQ